MEERRADIVEIVSQLRKAEQSEVATDSETDSGTELLLGYSPRTFGRPRAANVRKTGAALFTSIGFLWFVFVRSTSGGVLSRQLVDKGDTPTKEFGTGLSGRGTFLSSSRIDTFGENGAAVESCESLNSSLATLIPRVMEAHRNKNVQEVDKIFPKYPFQSGSSTEGCSLELLFIQEGANSHDGNIPQFVHHIKRRVNMPETCRTSVSAWLLTSNVFSTDSLCSMAGRGQYPHGFSEAISALRQAFDPDGIAGRHPRDCEPGKLCFWGQRFDFRCTARLKC